MLRNSILTLAVLALTACFNDRSVGENPRPFDSAVWKQADTWSEVRCDMVHDLLDRVGLVGRTRAEVIALLGEPETHGTGVEHYELCPSFMDVWILEIHWQDGRVNSTNIRDT